MFKLNPTPRKIDRWLVFQTLYILYIYMLYNHVVIIACHIVYWWTVMFKVNKEFEFEFGPLVFWDFLFLLKVCVHSVWILLK